MSRSAAATQGVASRRPQPPRPWIEAICVVALYSLATYTLLYPLFVAPGSTLFDPTVRGGLSLFSLGDMYTVLWVMSWGAHALATDPLSLFDANIFHPATSALTSTEHMLGHLPVFGPVYLTSGNPVLANQVNLFVALSLCGAAMYGLLRWWGCARLAAAGGGLIFAYFPLRLQLVTHVHLVAGAYLVLAMIAFDKALVTGRLRWMAAFAAAFGLQCLCSFYLAYMSTVALAGYAAVAVIRAGRPAAKPLVQLAAATALAMVPFLLLAQPYLEARASGGLPAEQQHELLRYLSVRPWRLAFVRDEGYYAGAVVIALAVVALLPGAKSGRVSWARGGALAIAALCLAVAFGPSGDAFPAVTPYDLASRFVPGFAAMRAPSRFVLVAMVGLSALAGLGLDRLTKIVWTGRGAGRVLGSVLGVSAIAAIGWDYGWAQRSFATRAAEVGTRVPPVYRALAELVPGPVLELPAGGRGDPIEQERESLYTFRSIHTWLPLLNGRAGYEPLTYAPLMALARALPDARALELLQRSAGLRYVVLHAEDALPGERRRRRKAWREVWRDPPGLTRVGRYGAAILFEVERLMEPDLMPGLLDLGAATSVLGTRLRGIAVGDRRAVIEVLSVPDKATSGLIAPLTVSVHNSGGQGWPVFTPLAEHRVGLGCRWRTRSGAVAAEDYEVAWLPYDLRAGAALTVRFGCRAVVPPGDYDLEIGVIQSGTWFAGSVMQPVTVIAWRVAETARPEP